MSLNLHTDLHTLKSIFFFFFLALQSSTLFAESCEEAKKILLNVSNFSVEKAIDRYQEALVLCPTMAEAWYNLGLLYEREGEFSLAEEKLRKASELLDSPRIRTSLALLLLQQKKLEEAKDLFDQILENNPHEIDALHGKSVVLSALGDDVEARIATTNALKLSPENYNLQYNLGVLSERLGSLEEAEDAYRASIELSEARPEAFLRLAHLLMKRDKKNEAQTILEELLEDFPSQSDALRTLSYIYEERGDLDKAEVLLRQLLRSENSDDDDKLRLSSILLRRDQANLARELLDSVSVAVKSSKRYQLLAASSAASLGELAKAQELLLSLLKKDATDVDARELLADIYSAQGKSELAKKERERLKQLGKAD